MNVNINLGNFLYNGLYYAASPYSGVIVGTASIAIGTLAVKATKTQLEDIKGRFKRTDHAPKFTENLSSKYKKLYKESKLHRFAYNRNALIKKIENTLSVKENSVVLLHGPAGCGKTAIFQELVYRQVTETSEAFQDYQFIKLAQNEIFSLQKGVGEQIKEIMWSGGTDADLDRLFQEIRGKKYILFIDEAQEVLKRNFLEKKLEELSRGEVKIILALKTDTMNCLTFQWDDAMERRVPKIEIKEFSIKETIKALNEGLLDYEKMYGISIHKNVIPYVVALSSLKDIQSQQKTHFPHKAVHLLAEICSGIKEEKGGIHLLTIDKAIHYCADTNEKNFLELKSRVENIIQDGNLNEQNKLFNQHVFTYPDHQIDLSFSPHIKKLIKEMNEIFKKGKEGVFLLSSSSQLQQAVIGNLSSHYEIVRINLNKMISAHSQLNPEQARHFLEGFYQLCQKCQIEGKRPLIIHIEDGENLLNLLSDFPKKPELSSALTPIYNHISANPTMNQLLEKGMNSLNDLTQQFNLPQIDQSHLRTNPPSSISSSQSKQKIEEFKYPDFILSLGDLLKEKRLAFIATLQNSAQRRHPNLADIRSNCHLRSLPDLKYQEAFDYFKILYKLPETLIWQAILSATYYFDFEQNHNSTPVDIIDLLLKRVQQNLKEEEELIEGQNGSSKQELEACKSPSDEKWLQPLTHAVQQSQIEMGHSIADAEDIHSVIQKYHLLSEPLYTPYTAHHAQTIQEERHQFPSIKDFFIKMFAELKKAQYIIEDSKERRTFFLEEGAKTFQEHPNFFKGQQIYHFNAEPLLKGQLKIDFQKRMIRDQIRTLNSLIEKKGEKHALIFIDIPFHLQTEETCRLLETMVEKHKLHLIYFCKNSDFPLHSVKKETSQNSSASFPMHLIPSYLKVFIQPALSYFTGESSIDHSKNALSEPPLPLKLFENSHRIKRLYPLQEKELVLLLNLEITKDLYNDIEIDNGLIEIFAKLSLIYTPSTPIRELRKQFRSLICSMTKSEKKFTEEMLFAWFSQRLGKEIDEIKDAVNPKLTSLVSKVRRNALNYLICPAKSAANLLKEHKFSLMSAMSWFAFWTFSKFLSSAWKK